MSKYAFDYINGEKVEPCVVVNDFVLEGTHVGSIHVEEGTLFLNGELRGSLTVHGNGKAIINGKQNGSVSLESGALVNVFGEINGSTTLKKGSIVTIEISGRLAGSLHNNGEVIVRGIFGGSQSGQGKFVIEGTGCIKQPVVKNGTSYYKW